MYRLIHNTIVSVSTSLDVVEMTFFSTKFSYKPMTSMSCRCGHNDRRHNIDLYVIVRGRHRRQSAWLVTKSIRSWILEICFGGKSRSLSNESKCKNLLKINCAVTYRKIFCVKNYRFKYESIFIRRKSRRWNFITWRSTMRRSCKFLTCRLECRHVSISQWYV